MLTARSRLARSILVGFAALILLAGAAYASQAILSPQTDQNVDSGNASEDPSASSEGDELNDDEDQDLSPDPSASPDDDGAVDDSDDGAVDDADDGAVEDEDDGEVEEADEDASAAPEATDDAND